MMNITLLLSVISSCFISMVIATTPTCFTCRNLQDTTQCKNFTLCQKGELCYQEQNLVSNGGIINSVGCVAAEVCQLSATVFGKRDLHQTRGLQLCFQCCSTDFCNYRGCHQDYCANIAPCVNGATCTNTQDGYHCTCKPGFTGKKCETNIDECSSSPCRNGGLCTDLVNAYSCTCLPGFVGNMCEHDINECASSPCLHGGACIDQRNGFACLCPTSYIGTRCETLSSQNIHHAVTTRAPTTQAPIDCSNSPCLNGGVCIDQMSGFACLCPTSYIGVRCEIPYKQTPLRIETTPPLTVGTSCYICDGPVFLCENSYKISQCSSGLEQYCINKLINNPDGSRYVERSCATEDTCKTKWSRDSATKSDCVHYDSSMRYRKSFDCTFCCTGPNCNEDIKPSNLYH